MTELNPDVVAFFESDMPVSQWVSTPNMVDFMSDETLVQSMRQTLGRKFIAEDFEDDVGARLFGIVETWLPTQRESQLPFLRDVARKYSTRKSLSNAQAAGALNCYYAQLNWR